MKTILLFGAGKSATILIDYLLKGASENNWKLVIADASIDVIFSKTNRSPFADAVQVDINNNDERSAVIKRADVVISLLPPTLHFIVAKDCVQYSKHLLTASYLDDKMKSLQAEIEQKQLFFLCEMGLDPGIDHMSAMKIINEIKEQGGSITAFKSHCGGLVAPENDTNPWHYKISWNPRNVVLAGKAGAEYKWDGKIVHKDYKELFADCGEVNVDGLDRLAFYPNRDSLSYMPVYKLESTSTFIRTTLRYSSYCKGWNAIVQSGLANDTDILNAEGVTFKKWSSVIAPFIDDENKTMLEYLGLFENTPVPSSAKTSADILQYLLETKLAMQPYDKDMIVMLHEIEYELNGKQKKTESSLVVKGEDSLRTAMAKTVGLPLGIAAKFILDGTIQLSGLHVPVSKEIYKPVLKELEYYGVKFKEVENNFLYV